MARRRRRGSFLFGNAWYGHSKAHARAARKGHRRNPVTTGIGGLMKVGDWAPLAVTGGLSMATVGVVPNIVLPMVGIVNPFARWFTQLATAFVGGQVVGRFAGKQHGTIFLITGTSLVGYDLLKTYLLRNLFPTLPLAGPDDYYGADNPYGYAPGQDLTYGDMSAFPALSAFTQENAMAGSPYDSASSVY